MNTLYMIPEEGSIQSKIHYSVMDGNTNKKVSHIFEGKQVPFFIDVLSGCIKINNFTDWHIERLKEIKWSLEQLNLAYEEVESISQLRISKKYAKTLPS